MTAHSRPTRGPGAVTAVHSPARPGGSALGTRQWSLWPPRGRTAPRRQSPERRWPLGSGRSGCPDRGGAKVGVRAGRFEKPWEAAARAPGADGAEAGAPQADRHWDGGAGLGTGPQQAGVGRATCEVRGLSWGRAWAAVPTSGPRGATWAGPAGSRICGARSHHCACPLPTRPARGASKRPQAASPTQPGPSGSGRAPHAPRHGGQDWLGSSSRISSRGPQGARPSWVPRRGVELGT